MIKATSHIPPCFKPILFLILILISSLSFAKDNNQNTIAATSWQWTDTQSRQKSLDMIPKWTHDQIIRLYASFQDPSEFNLPIMINGKIANYSALFINSLWGPIDNPFTTLNRPAKFFIFLNTSNNHDNFHMAPIVQDEESGLFYVFEKEQKQPTELMQWIFHISNGDATKLRFNVCPYYGVSPSDICDDTTFENEIYRYPDDLHLTNKRIQSQNIQGFVSSLRQPNKHWQLLAHQYQKKHLNFSNSIIRTSISWLDIDKRNNMLNQVTPWHDYQIIKENFKLIRDLRYFKDEAALDFKRRISWLFPDDGCWTRLSATLKDFFGPMNNPVNTYRRPSKIFAFGNLCTLTNNTNTGSIRWWYHAAAIIKDHQTQIDYVLDPSINANEPMQVEHWIQTITSREQACYEETPTNIKFTICNGYGISPYDTCEAVWYESFEKEISAELIQRYFRRFERNRQIELGRNPNDVLGELPPWKS